MKYIVIYERSADNWGAFAPDLPGYAATAETLDGLREIVREGPFSDRRTATRGPGRPRTDSDRRFCRDGLIRKRCPRVPGIAT